MSDSWDVIEMKLPHDAGTYLQALSLLDGDRLQDQVRRALAFQFHGPSEGDSARMHSPDWRPTAPFSAEGDDTSFGIPHEHLEPIIAHGVLDAIHAYVEIRRNAPDLEEKVAEAQARLEGITDTITPVVIID